MFRRVSDCYQEILEREPDAGGLLRYGLGLENGEFTPDEVRTILLQSEEFLRNSLSSLYGRWFLMPPHPDEFNLMFHSLKDGLANLEALERVFRDSPDSICHRAEMGTVLAICRDRFGAPLPDHLHSRFLHIFECAGRNHEVFTSRLTTALCELRRDTVPLFHELLGRAPSVPELMEQVEKFTTPGERFQFLSRHPEAQRRVLDKALSLASARRQLRPRKRLLAHVLTNEISTGGCERLLQYWDRFGVDEFDRVLVHRATPEDSFPYELKNTERLAFATIVNLNRILESLRPDVIIDHSSLFHPDQHPGMYSGFERKVVHFIHSCELFDLDPDTLRDRYALPVHRVISNFRPTDRSPKWNHIPMLVQPLAIDLAAYPIHDRTHRFPLTAGIVGRMEPDKIPESFLKVLGKFRSQDIKIRLYGAGSHYLGEIRHELQDNPDVTYEGVIPPARICEVYRSLDILLCPSTTESGGYALLEAMASGVPVVARNTHPLPQTVGSGGVLVEPDDESLIEGLKSFRDSIRLRELSRKARQQVLEHNGTLSRQFRNYHRFIESAPDTSA